jgi:uncharacterized OB-fold protein
VVKAVERDHSTAEFFDATARGVFPLRRCAPCGRFVRPQAHQCQECGGTDLEWVEASGAAKLVSWAVIPPRDEGAEPLVVVIGELEEGPWWWSCLAGSPDPAELGEGRRLRVGFERPEGSEAVPVFLLDG